MASKRSGPPDTTKEPKPKRKCGHCKVEGHNRTTCPVLQADAGRLGAENTMLDEDPSKTTLPRRPGMTQGPIINLHRSLFVVFDLETTGFAAARDEIIELAAVVLSPDGIQLEDGTFSSFVKPERNIPSPVTQITGITNEMVSSAPPFPDVAKDFFEFLNYVQDLFQAVEQEQALDEEEPIQHFVLVAHNGKRFDIRFLHNMLKRYDLEHYFINDSRFGFAIDTMEHARKVYSEKQDSIPSSYRLGDLFQFITGVGLDTAHRAMADVKATICILRHPALWDARKKAVFRYLAQPNTTVPTTAPNLTFDLDEDDDDTDNEVVDDNDSESSPIVEEVEVLGDHWKFDEVFLSPDPSPEQLFQEEFKRVSRTETVKTGLIAPIASVNSPLRAWRQIFTTHILDKIVQHTNDYGEFNAKNWTPISRQDLEDFIAVLFLMSIQKRKDKPSNWFSTNALLACPAAKKITSGRKFNTMLRYLHCCSLDHQQLEGEEYDPAYKVADLRDYIEKRSQSLFVPGQQLSLDESLIRAFGRMKFKVRIISKAARYGIKVYVITDATTAYVLKVIIYTGRSTYTEERGVDEKKTVQIVKALCQPFKDSYRTIYVDRFYTSIDLLKELRKMNLFVTGTMVANRVPKDIRIAKSSSAAKQMKRGDAKQSIFVYKDNYGRSFAAGLVAWRDRNIVHCLTNDTSTGDFDECTRRSKDGLITIPRPICIAKYNQYMGGVDLADMRRLHCNSTVMGQNRWWLKLFFYILDVGTSNALVLYNLGRSKAGSTKAPMNIFQFKMKVIEAMVGDKIESLEGNGGELDIEHTAVHIEGNARLRCAYCALLSKSCRTRFICSSCEVPLCCMGSGRTSNDCFAMAHKTEETTKLVIEKYEHMLKRVTKKNKNKN